MPQPFDSSRFFSDNFFGETVTVHGRTGRRAVIDIGPDPATAPGIAKAVGNFCVATVPVGNDPAIEYGQEIIQADDTTWTVQSVQRSGDCWKCHCAGTFAATKPKA
jgi:uncharacterized Zn-binding protein involved in type VI secretion